MKRERIKELLDAQGMSISSFARKIDVPQPTLYRIVNGNVNLDRVGVNHFMSIAHGLGLTAEELYYDLDAEDAVKSEIDSTYSSTTAEGRRALLATARGVRETYSYEAIGFPERAEDVGTAGAGKGGNARA